MDIDSVMDRFCRIPGARAGRGPRHPRDPDPAPAARLTEFLDTYPSLRSDRGYVAFLERYGGAAIEGGDDRPLVDVLGFSDASTGLLEMDGPVVDDDGFLLFAQYVHHRIEGGKLLDTEEQDFAFDTTGERKPGVYRLFSSRRVSDDDFDWYAEDFLSWLDRLVRQDGILPRPEE
ncbi:hypothetical protein AB0J86_28725 [Micromonospora sp. NPDC049559]|uniref:hypothetical protein n=1 Tax=Micromonospora sp. NPDC049559 TaxID=3155923 RepID=UPI0034481104